MFLRKGLLKEEFRCFHEVFTALKLYSLIEEVARCCMGTVEGETESRIKISLKCLSYVWKSKLEKSATQRVE